MATKIIFDTDIGCDCDDAAALALALELMNAGECELLAVTHCTMNESAAGCIEAILEYYGHPEIPVGTFRDGDGIRPSEWHDVYASDVALRWDTRYKRGASYENTVKLMRRILAQTQGKMTLVATGSFASLERLLKSGPDEHSDLSGLALVEQKVERTVCMAGRFKEACLEPEAPGADCAPVAEWNVKCDIPAAQAVCDHWPSELIFCGYEIGLKMITCGGLQLKGAKDNPVRLCCESWSGKDGGGAVGRESWDGATMLYAIRPDAGYWDLYPYGRIRIDDEGRSLWQEEAGGRHSFLLERTPYKKVEGLINEILERDIGRREGVQRKGGISE